MSCPYFKEGYVGACTASETQYFPSIARMESYCFEEDYGLCPNIAESLSGADTKKGPHHPPYAGKQEKGKVRYR